MKKREFQIRIDDEDGELRLVVNYETEAAMREAYDAEIANFLEENGEEGVMFHAEMVEVLEQDAIGSLH